MFRFSNARALVVIPVVHMVTCLCSVAGPAAGAERPNILWITSEDNGPFLGCYGDKFADTPNLDRLAAEGILYENAVANAPVCAPARSTIITGMYASSLGTHPMRSRNGVPEYVNLFPWYLRQAGYYCSNHSKTDYNLAPVQKDAWDEITKGHYKNRKPGQPFFAVFNLTVSHESSLHGSKVEPEFLVADFELPPYHPDTPEIRSNWVQYYRIVSRMDQQVGDLLRELDEAGLADDTIVFYYSDHGGILPRSKRFLYDTGVHVPMIVRFPPKYRHLGPAGPGSRIDRPVSFVDLAPTVLSLAGLPVPDHMQGHVFHGPQATESPRYNYMFRGRMDERYDMMRAVRGQRYKYIRNYLPHRVYAQHLDYLWRMPATQSWERAYKAGECNAVQSAFWQPKPTEELYDLTSDPWEVRNLAECPGHQAVLEEMREANREHILRIRDAGFLPEAEMMQRAAAAGLTIREMAQDVDLYPLERILATAELAGERKPDNLPRLIALLGDDDSGVRFWAATGCAALGAGAAPAADALEPLLDDPSPDVRIAAAESLCLIGRPAAALATLEKLLSHGHAAVALRAVNTLENLGDLAKPALGAIRQTAAGAEAYVKRAADRAVEVLGP
ncbi:MAG: sulfatase-like hydrolase/transferase [Thermoguttaceae bacterium]|jgi:arylsulfatase A-like enzyme|nr:sulfatase-like hydrolase/transferase [Thermoguttaceae bacterium]